MARGPRRRGVSMDLEFIACVRPCARLCRIDSPRVRGNADGVTSCGHHGCASQLHRPQIRSILAPPRETLDGRSERHLAERKVELPSDATLRGEHRGRLPWPDIILRSLRCLLGALRLRLRAAEQCAQVLGAKGERRVHGFKIVSKQRGRRVLRDNHLNGVDDGPDHVARGGSSGRAQSMPDPASAAT